MKKTLLTLSLIVLTLGLFAGAPLKVKNGNLSLLKQKSVATFEMDFSQTRFDKDEDFKTWCEGDYDARVELMNETFFKEFNAKNFGMKLTKDGDAQYKLVVKWNNFDHKPAGMVWGQMYMMGEGFIDVIDLSTDKSVLKIEICKDHGFADFVENDRFKSLMECVVKDLSKMTK